MKKMSWQQIVQKGPLLLGAVVLFILVLYDLDKLNIIHILNDEYGYWAAGALMSGKDWSDVTAHSYYYSYGYSVILSVLMKVFSGPEILYKASVVVNAVFLVLSYFITAYIIKKIFTDIRGYWICILAGLTTVYSANIVQTQINWTETCMYLLFWAEAALIYMLWEKPSCFKAILAGLTVSYMFMVHQRSLAVIAASAIVLLVMAICEKVRKIHVLCFFIVIVSMILIHFSLKDHLINVLYQGSGSVTGNDFSGQYDKIKEILTSWGGMAKALTGFMGKLFYVGAATLGIVFAAIYYLLKKWRLSFRAKEGKGFCDGVTVFGLFALLSLLFALGIGTVFMLNGDRIDSVIYGRYTEYVIGPSILIGFWVLMSGKLRIREYGLCLAILLLLGGLTAFRMRYVPTAEFNIIPNVGVSLFYRDGENGVYSTVKLDVFLGAVSVLMIAAYAVFCREIQRFRWILLGVCGIFWLSTAFYIQKVIVGAQTSLYTVKELTDIIEAYGTEEISIDYVTEYDDWDSRSIQYVQFMLPDARVNYHDLRQQADPDLTSTWRIYNVEDIFGCMDGNLLLYKWQDLILAADADSMEAETILEDEVHILNNEDRYDLLSDRNMASQTRDISEDWNNHGQEGFLVYGPYMELAEGSYVLDIRLDVSEDHAVSETDPIGYVDVCSNGQPFAKVDIKKDDANIDVPFTMDEDMARMEFRVYIYKGNTVNVDQMYLTKTDIY